MILRGIRGHSTAIFGLAENTPILISSGEERKLIFFIARGAVHSVVGTPYLADNRATGEHSQDIGEALSYKEPYGRRFFIPICSAETREWNLSLPKGIEMCNAKQI
ncbi:hypothetical protein O181_031358 [Austropuccinia psidii MF-1]|uniref:Uncharacterized protein n=1 Tax=Austropuccinia psidii MF-1 TaxID=1389203 RepID=A0A9Q3CXA9_9BASI|nr:hypothetical protein [Austropuccinia psidii MF-1]